jgi:hypothetical protein
LWFPLIPLQDIKASARAPGTIIDGRAIAALKSRGIQAGLAFVRVGEDPPPGWRGFYLRDSAPGEIITTGMGAGSRRGSGIACEAMRLKAGIVASNRGKQFFDRQRIRRGRADTEQSASFAARYRSRAASSQQLRQRGQISRSGTGGPVELWLGDYNTAAGDDRLRGKSNLLCRPDRPRAVATRSLRRICASVPSKKGFRRGARDLSKPKPVFDPFILLLEKQFLSIADGFDFLDKLS